MPVLHWFRRDLRLTDNTALSRALAEQPGHVIPVFVLDDALLRRRDVAPARVKFLLQSLADLDERLRQRHSRLIVRRGDSQDQLLALVRETGAHALYFNRDSTPFARARDAAVTTAMHGAGVRVESHRDLTVFEGSDVLTQAGQPYTVFTPYKKAWLTRPRPLPADLDEAALRFDGPLPATIDLPDEDALGFACTQRVQHGGETVALALLREFIKSRRLENYAAQRDMLSEPGTSTLSPHLRFGTLSPRICVRAAEDGALTVDKAQRAGFDTWLSELIWREFYYQVLFHFPHADKGNFKRNTDALRWGNGNAETDQRYFEAWCAGRTGYPVVDAAMRQLNAIGWMHNRARMIVASFLTKDLLLDWRLGESYFMRQLVDGDPASNNGGWHWAASTGTDAQPYFRIFNPRLQSERFDRDGVYIRRWVPELCDVADRHIHAPHEMTPLEQHACKCVIGEHYPAPIIDHAVQKEKILARFKALDSAR